MDDEFIDQKLQEALQLFEAGKNYQDIRNHFNELDDDSISYIIRLVDEFAIENGRIHEKKQNEKFKMYLGIGGCTVSAFLIFIFYQEDILGRSIGLLAYLPMIFSIYLLWKGYKGVQLSQKESTEIDDSKFRMKRRKNN